MNRLKPFPVQYEREVIAAVFRAAIDYIGRKKRLEVVKLRVPEATALVIEKPPMPLRFMSAEHIDQLYIAYGEHATRRELVDLGRHLSRATGTGAAAPVLKMALSLFGATPLSVFSNMDRFFSLATRGISFAWEQTGERSGHIDTVFAPGAPPPASATVLEGNLAYAFEMLGIETGVIENRQIFDDGHRVRVLARW